MLDALFIGHDNLFWDVHTNCDVFGGRLHFYYAHHVVDRGADFALNGLWLEGAPLNLGVVKGVVHVVQHHHGGELDDLQMLALNLVLFLGEQKVGKVNAGAQRRPHFMAHIRRVHGGQAVLRFALPQLLQRCDVLQEDKCTFLPEEVDVLDTNR